MEGVFSGPPYETGLDLLITNRAEPRHDQELKNFKERNSVANLPRSGRPKNLNTDHKKNYC